MRLLAVVRRSGRNAFSRPSRIEVGDTSGRGGQALGRVETGGQQRSAGHDLTLDIDLEDDERATRNRIRDGGGVANVAGRAKQHGTEREGLMHGHDYHDDDEEEEEEL